MISEKKIKDIVGEQVSLPEFIVDVTVSKSNHIQVFVDSMEPFDIGSCRRISRAIESELDRDKEDFQLDVSSPGLDKAFKVIEQYQKYLNRKVDIWTEDETYMDALLQEVDSEKIQIEVTEKKKKIVKILSFNEIVKTKPSISFK